MTEFETCFDRDYECCDLTPPDHNLTYDEWYDRHVEAWREHLAKAAKSGEAHP